MDTMPGFTNTELVNRLFRVTLTVECLGGKRLTIDFDSAAALASMVNRNEYLRTIVAQAVANLDRVESAKFDDKPASQTAVAACAAWADGEHCFEIVCRDPEGTCHLGRAWAGTVVGKQCLCGAEIARA